MAIMPILPILCACEKREWSNFPWYPYRIPGSTTDFNKYKTNLRDWPWSGSSRGGQYFGQVLSLLMWMRKTEIWILCSWSTVTDELEWEKRNLNGQKTCHRNIESSVEFWVWSVRFATSVWYIGSSVFSCSWCFDI